MAVYANLNSFNAGELSPKMIGRSDVSQYGKGCRKLQNFLVTPYGAVERRPGTKFLSMTKYPEKNLRLIRFVFSSETAYVCEFGDFYIRFFKDDSPVMTDEGEILEIPSPYSETELSDIQFIQSADVMTIVHPEHPVYELKRFSHNSFTLTEKEFEYPPVLDPNLDDGHSITPSALTGEITLSASKDTFTSENIGGYFQLVHTRKTNEISKDFTGNGVSASIEVFGYWTFVTHGTWSGRISIQRSFDSGNSWSNFRTYSSSKDSNTSTSGEEEQKNVLYRLQMEAYSQSDSGTLKLCRCLFVNPDFQTTGVVKISSVTDAKHASGIVISKLGSTDPTAEWNEGAWSKRRGFPRSIAYYEERMMFGGNASKPQTVWGSRTADWDNFLIGAEDDAALDFTLSSDTVNTICWMCQHDALVIGTMDSEWTLSSSDAVSALTASNFRAKRQSVYGSLRIPAQMVGESILFVQRGARKVREFIFQLEKDGYSSPDMTILADHVTDSGIREIALQQLPDSILWCILNNGSAAALTYERDQQVIGWHRHVTDGKILSCAVIPEGDADSIYFAVERNGSRMIEKMMPRNFSSVKNAFFIDSGITVSGNQMTEINGLSHLEGKTLQVLADGAVQEKKTVRNGKISLDVPANIVSAGLGYLSILSPMPLEIDMQNGQSNLRKKAIGELRIRFYNSVGGEARAGNDQFQKVVSRTVIADSMDHALDPRDDVVLFNALSGHDFTPVIEVRQTDPLPMNVASLSAVYDLIEP